MWLVSTVTLVLLAPACLLRVPREVGLGPRHRPVQTCRRERSCPPTRTHSVGFGASRWLVGRPVPATLLSPGQKELTEPAPP